MKTGLEHLLQKDPDVRKHFSGQDGALLSREDPLFKKNATYLEEALGRAYDARFNTYEKSAMTKYATGLRVVSGVGAAVAGLLFWPLGGTAGLYYALGSAAGNLLADSLDTGAYIKEGKLTGMQGVGVSAKALPHKVLSWFVPGYGLLDSLMGRKRFEYATSKQALYDAKDTFLGKAYLELGREHKIVSIENFRDKRYAKKDEVAASKAA
jgi:hypothetical protein